MKKWEWCIYLVGSNLSYYVLCFVRFGMEACRQASGYWKNGSMEMKCGNVVIDFLVVVCLQKNLNVFGDQLLLTMMD